MLCIFPSNVFLYPHTSDKLLFVITESQFYLNQFVRKSVSLIRAWAYASFEVFPLPPYHNMCVSMWTQPQFLHCLCVHCMPVCVSFVSVHLYTYKCAWWWDIVVSSSFLCKNSEGKKKWGREWIQSALCENCLWAELKQQGEREAAAGRGEERRVFICSSARGKRWRREGEGDQERWGVCSYADQQVWECMRIRYSVQRKQIINHIHLNNIISIMMQGY